MKKIYFFLFMLLGSVGVWAQSLLVDDFTGTPATLLTANGWVAHSGTGVGPMSIASPGLIYTGYLSSGVGNATSASGNSEDVNKAFTSTTSGSVYYSFMINASPSITTGDYSLHLCQSSGGAAAGFYGRFFIQKDATTGLRFGLSKISNAASAVFTPYSYTTGTTYLIVVKYTFNTGTTTDDAVYMYVNPVPGAAESAPTVSVTAEVTTDATALTAIGIRQWNAGTLARFDGIRVGTTWASVTPPVAAGPLITVTPASLTGFSALLGVPSAEQTYTVGGTDLTNDIVITPPVGFEISLTTAVGFIANPATITLTQTAGTVATTTLYVRMNSGALGLNTGNITHTSAGSNDPNVALSGNSLSNEPISQGVISFGTITNSTIQVNFTAGAGTNQILVVRALTPVANHPADGTTYTPSTIFGLGTNLGGNTYAVYTGVSAGSVTVSGLTAGTQYHFALYEYDDEGVPGAENYLISPLSVGDATTIDVPVIYTWIGGSSLWTTAINWAPARLFPATNDILLFLDGTTETVTAVPNETIGQLNIMNVTGGTNVTLQAAATTTTLTIGGLAVGADLTVAAGCQLNIDGANGYTINVATGATATVDGAMTFTGGAHRLTAVDPSGVTFNTGAVFTSGASFTGNPFGTTSLLSVIFGNGSTFLQTGGGANPFGAGQPNSVVVFQTGSLYKSQSTGAPSFNGRTYANVEIDNAAFSLSPTGTALLSMDNLTITQGILNLNLTGGISIKGNISVASGATLTFSPAAANTLSLNGTTAQSISNLGTLTFTANENVTVNNAAGVTLNAPVTLLGTLTFTNGAVTTTATNLLTMAAGSAVTGASNASFVNGPVAKIGNTAFTFPVGKQTCGPSGTAKGYAALTISNLLSAVITDQFTAEYLRQNVPGVGLGALGVDHKSICDDWMLTRDGPTSTATVDVTLAWDDSINNCTTLSPYVDWLPSLTIVRRTNSLWEEFAMTGQTTGTTVTGTILWGGINPQPTGFGTFSLASMDFHNPLPITINYFNGAKQSGSHLLNWKVNCNSTPSCTLVLERSTDGRNYSEVYSINATALRCQQPFNYTDAAPAKGVNYYRLKMIDATGKISYSSIVSLINASSGFDILNIAPNPIVNGNFKLNISAAKNMAMDIVITDMQGRVMQKQTVNMSAGFNAIPMNVTNLSAGNYQVYGNTADGRSRVLRFVIQ